MVVLLNEILRAIELFVSARWTAPQPLRTVSRAGPNFQGFVAFNLLKQCVVRV